MGAAAWERLQTRLVEVNRDIRTRGIRTLRGVEGGMLDGFGTDLLTGYAYKATPWTIALSPCIHPPSSWASR